MTYIVSSGTLNPTIPYHTYLLVFVCLYVYFDVLHSLHVVCRLVYLTHFHVCTHIHAVVNLSLSAFVRFLLKKLLACLKTAIFALVVRITGKLLKIDGYMLRDNL